MALDNSYLQYPERSYGMDHNRYDWSMLAQRKPVQWPNGKKLAVWVNVGLQQFPLDQKGVPFKVPGGMTMPYPDLRHFSLRDYGNRVGLYRFLKAFDKYGVKPTFAINTELAEQNPYLLDVILKREDELMCHGWNMDSLHFGGQEQAAEAELVTKSVQRLREISGQAIRGWISPAKNQSENTPELLKANGIDFHCDWVNDDMPYAFNTNNGSMWSMPLSTELSDQFVLMNNLHSEQSYVEQIIDATSMLAAEADSQGGRILALQIHPWLLGQPHRIAKLEQVLAHLAARDDVWFAHASEILDCYTKQQ
ncbi:polysaccharide deacetylase family protein [Thalassomonas sp. M1454]|uniref:polysaccharide deacetylase family protein n=1 Tax=Thalassomonas sp. M1454 TaxID=2594477 RepID=UPI00117CF3BE|nr:polysaccharide deacetylase family protein [Thalassomonas sp. M1454]TRX54985.1 polysaccharide deacetylase family protein [Thalassomonas sp. M1454]